MLRRISKLRWSAVNRVSMRCMSTAAPGSGPSQDPEAQKLIAAYPYPWPWGQRINVDTGKLKLDLLIPQNQPGKKQHKLAYKIDTAPPEVPHAPTTFIGPAGKATHLLFNAAVKANKLDGVYSSLEKFSNIWEVKREVKLNLMNPRTSVEDKLSYVREVAKAIGADDLAIETLVALQKDKKLHKIGDITKNFKVLLAEHRKERYGAIISAEPLSEQNYEAITSKMRKLVKGDEKLIISREVEPALVGGFIIRIGNRAQDLSVQAQINRMETHLKEFFSKNKEAIDKVLAS